MSKESHLDHTQFRSDGSNNLTMRESNTIPSPTEHPTTEHPAITHSLDDNSLSSPMSKIPEPDMGATAWITVAGGFSLIFVSFGWITCIGIFQEYYQAHQLKSYAPSTVAWIASVETCSMFVWSPIIGKLFDNYGPYWLIVVGSLLHVSGLFMVTLCTQYYQFILAQSICSATGASMLFFTGTTSVSTWFVRRRALALGITVAGSSLGGIVFPIAMGHLVPRLGFSWAIRICAFLILALCIFAFFTVKSRLEHTPKPVRLQDYWRPLRETTFSTFTLGYFLFYMGFFVPYNFVILEAKRKGMTDKLAAYLIPILNAGGLLGRIAPGWAADRLGSFNVMIIATLFSAVTILAVWIPGRSNGAIIAFCILYGFGSGAFISLAPAILAQISPLNELGARQGTCFIFIAIASLIGNPIAGALVADTSADPFWKLQLFAGMIMISGTLVIGAARVNEVGFSLKKVI